MLQGIRDERQFLLVMKTFDAFLHVDLADYELAVRATRCIEDGLTLLHADRDFLPVVEHFGLREAIVSG